MPTSDVISEAAAQALRPRSEHNPEPLHRLLGQQDLTLRAALDDLSYRDRRVLELLYEHRRTRDEVGRTFNVTRERIRQIEKQALRKLSSP